MGANKIGIQQEAASLSAIFPFLKETMRPWSKSVAVIIVGIFSSSIVFDSKLLFKKSIKTNPVSADLVLLIEKSGQFFEWMVLKKFNNMIRLFAVGIEDSGKSTCTYSGKYFRPDAMFMQSLHNPQMGKSFL